MSDVETIFTVKLERLFLGINVAEVHEVLPAQALTPVPLAHPMVAGLINLRGQIVSAVDLRRVLRLPPRGVGESAPINVIVRCAADLVSLQVDQVGDVIEVPRHLLTEPPDTTSAETKRLFRGAYQLTGQLMLVFDTQCAWQAIVAQVESKAPRQDP